MREDTTFSDRKLTQEEFSKKYWMGGKTPYQYHTGTIEDGRDEREQFLFNDVRALSDMIRDLIIRGLATLRQEQSEHPRKPPENRTA